MILVYDRRIPLPLAEFDNKSAGNPPFEGQRVGRVPRPNPAFLQQSRRRYSQMSPWGVLDQTMPTTPPVFGPTAIRPRVKPQPAAMLRRGYRQGDTLPAFDPGNTAGAPPLLGQSLTQAQRARRLPPPRKPQPPGKLPPVPLQSLFPAALTTVNPFRPFRWRPWHVRRGGKLQPLYIFPLPQEGDQSAIEPVTTGTGAPFMGGLAIVAMEWISSHGLAVSFESTYGTSYQYQLYAGRQLVGATVSTSDTQIIAQLFPSSWPQWLTLLAVPAADRDTSFGPLLPPNPYNCVELNFAAVGQPANAEWIEITAGTVVGGAVSLSNVVGLIPFVGNQFYSWVSQPLHGTGAWNFQLAMRDDCPPNGNRGPAAAVSSNVITLPPDVAIVAGQRFEIAIAAGVATVTFAYP